MAYAWNYCPNPSFQLGLNGYSALADTVMWLDTSNVLHGVQSLYVHCPGNQAGEGIITASALINDTSTGSASLFLAGTGVVTVFAVSNPGGIILASAPVTISSEFTRVVLNNLSLTANTTVSLMVETNTAVACDFWVSGVQVEESSPANKYIDGDQPGCMWMQGFWGGISAQLYQNPVEASSSSKTSSNVVNVLVIGQSIFATPVKSISHNYNPVVYIGNAGPIGAITDFGIAQLTDPDPAQTYVSWNNAGKTTATGANYSTSYGIFVPPKDYVVSNGALLYKRAAYMALGWKFASVPNNGTLLLSRAQAEVLPLSTGSSVASPTAYDLPRTLHSIVVANRMNLCTNPSFEVSVANWSATGAASISRDATTSVGQITKYDDSIITSGTASMKVTINSPGDGAVTTISNLITGNTYIASMYVQAGQGLANILMSIDGASTSVLSSGGTGYGFGDYNDGPYGGIPAGSDLTTLTWYRISAIFTATADSHTLLVSASPAGDVVYPTHMWADAVLVEPGQVLGGYFDGSSGPNYTWDSVTGSTGLARSYYYDQMKLKQQAFLNILQQHVPLGISAATPLYSVPPIS